jgi:Subtilase family
LPDDLSHLLVLGRSSDEGFHRLGRGNPRIRLVEDRAAHCGARLREVEDSLDAFDDERAALDELTEDELQALGSIVILEGDDPGYLLRLDSLERLSQHRVPRPRWLLLSVTPPRDSQPERAVVWVSDAYRAGFIKLFEDYLAVQTAKGNPANNALVANISRIRAAVLSDLWQSSGEPETTGIRWWEIWLRPAENNVELARLYAQTHSLRFSNRVLSLSGRVVVWIEAAWPDLQTLPFTAVPVAEIRRPEFVDTVEDLSAAEQDEYVADLAERVEPAGPDAPAVCHLDTGVARTHVLLASSLDPDDLHTVIGTSGFDRAGHGTMMAGLALYGSLDSMLASGQPVTLLHRLESVRILPDSSEPPNDPITYGDITAQAISAPEAVSSRQRVFCLPVTHRSDLDEKPGQPTLWSAAIDALAAGVSVARDGDELALLGAPEPEAARLIVVSAGNVDSYEADHLQASDLARAEDPAQAWNALTVGAHTTMVTTPSDPQYEGWEPVAQEGDLSPHSRTSLLFGNRPWPIKPDIVLEGGNVLTDGLIFEDRHPRLSLRTIGISNDLALASANATSAATAQAARLAALAWARYPSYWPETVRGLLVHAAEWTPVMRAEIDKASNLAAKQLMLRRYGWGVPSEDTVLHSTGQAVTLVVQDAFVPFAGSGYAMPAFRLHRLPWPTEPLEQLGSADVTLRVTLSYFVEPTASRRGWRQRYSYPSHGLRFDLQDPLENEQHFIERTNRDAHEDETGSIGPSSSQIKWLLGSQQRNYGSLHQDIWHTSGQELAQTGMLAVYPVGGWWKRNRNKERIDLPVRYALIVSLRTRQEDIDLYTPIATELSVPIETQIPGT